MKDIINWNYERGSWQWDVLCLVILTFIFLTPKEWFNKYTNPATPTTSSTVEWQKVGNDVAHR
jgi:hypothetical protein